MTFSGVSAPLQQPGGSSSLSMVKPKKGKGAGTGYVFDGFGGPDRLAKGSKKLGKSDPSGFSSSWGAGRWGSLTNPPPSTTKEVDQKRNVVPVNATAGATAATSRISKAPMSHSNLIASKADELQHKTDSIEAKVQEARESGGAMVRGMNSRITDKERSQMENGWQMIKDNVMDRVAALFNNKLMADVKFEVGGFDIPAHKLVLASASPVFYSRFFEWKAEPAKQQLAQKSVRGRRTSMAVTQTSTLNNVASQITVVQINEMCPGAFFEFIRFIYTDKCNITIDNVSNLIFLADDYKVAGLTERCLEYCQTQILPDRVLRILQVLRTLLLKSVVCLWRDVVEREAMGAEKGGAGFLGGNEGAKTKVGFEFSKKSQQMAFKLGQVGMELEEMCWRCVGARTEAVLVTEDFLQQDIKTVRAILGLHKSSIPEISLFRAMHAWAGEQCTKHGMEATPENRRKFVSTDTLLLIRFPAMTLEQLQWEVVPTGLLPYRDIAPVLQYKSNHNEALFRFNAQMREGQDENEKSQRAQRPSALMSAVPVYQPEEDDPIDAMLSAHLLQLHLRATVKPGRPKHVAHMMRWEPGSRSRLATNITDRDMDDWGDGHALPTALEFKRIGPGLYEHKGRTLKLELEGGEVIVYDVGPLGTIVLDSDTNIPWDNESKDIHGDLHWFGGVDNTSQGHKKYGKLGTPLTSFF